MLVHTRRGVSFGRVTSAPPGRAAELQPVVLLSAVGHSGFDS